MKPINKKILGILSISLVLSTTPIYAKTKVNTKTTNQKTITVKVDEKRVKNVILLIPDGQTITALTLARWYQGGQPLAVDEITTGLVRTYNADTPIADSAPAGTAMATGFKSNTKYIGVLPSVATLYGVEPIKEGDEQKPIATILEAAKLQGKATGIISTSNIQHATPADFTSHYPDRNNYDGLAEQQVYNKLDVALGAGYKYLVKEKRADKEDLLDELNKLGYTVVKTKEEMEKTNSNKLFGLFADDALAYEFDRETNRPSEPSLSEMTSKAISILSKDKDGFFLMVEGSKVDWAAHANDPIGVISDVLAFDKAVKEALDFAKKDGNTVVIVASDHGNGGLSIGNKETSSNYDKVPLSAFIDPLKKVKLTGEGLEAKLNSDRSNVVEVMKEYYGITDLTEDEIKLIKDAKVGSLNYATGPIVSRRAYLGWTTNGHTGEEVALHVYHPKKQVLMGTVQNTDIPKYMAEVMGLDLKIANDRLFHNIMKTLETAGLEYYWNNGDFVNPELVITDGVDKMLIPANKDYYVLNGKKVQSPGVNVFINGEKFYVAKDIVNLITGK